MALFIFGWGSVYLWVGCLTSSLGLVYSWLGSCLILAWFALHLAQDLFILARALFNFGLVCLALAQVLFTLARVLFNFGLVCPAFSPGLIYFG